MKYLFVVRGFSPEISASGNLLKPLVEEVAKNHFVCVLSCAQYNSNEITNTRVHLIKTEVKKKNRINRYLSSIKKIFSSVYYEKNIVDIIKKQIEINHIKYSFDYIFAVSFEEILALLDAKIDHKLKRVVLLERFASNSSLALPFLKRKKEKDICYIEERIMKETNRLYLLPTVYEYLCNKYGSVIMQNIEKIEHPMIVDNIITKKNRDKKYTILYAGGLDRKDRNPIPMIKFLSKINNLLPLEVVFYSYGNMQKTLITMKKMFSFIRIEDPVDPDKLKRLVADFDFIVTIGNKDSVLVPSKLFDCISSGKPIIHFSQLINDPYDNYLSKYPKAICLKYNTLNSPLSINKMTEYLIKEKNSLVSFYQIQKEFYNCTPKYVASQITDI